MTWTAARDLANATIVAQFGEVVTLADASAISGVFRLFDPRIQPVASASEVGRTMRPSQQQNPVLLVLDSVAAALAEGDTVTVRESSYRITRIDTDGQGMSTVALTPSAESRAQATFERWR